MKKKFTLIILALVLFSPVFTIGQRSNFYLFSLDFGINSTWILNQNMYGNPEMAYSSKFGLSGVATYRHFINGYGYSIGAGLENLGQKYSGEMAGAAAKRRVNLTYVQIPVMGIYNLGGKSQRTWLSFGPQFMFLVSAQQDFKREAGTIIPKPEMLNPGSTDVFSRFNPIEVMLAFELTHIFISTSLNKSSYRSENKAKWSASFKGALGLTDINSTAFQVNNTHNLYGGSHNFYMGINIGYMFNPVLKSHKASRSYNGRRGDLRIPGHNM
jgi:hypothetical protein